jgi:peptide/nickel transport system permease protein
MVSYLVRRLAQFVPVLIIGSIAIWAIIYAIPGDPAYAIAGPDATDAQIEAVRASLGLDKPMPVQYLTWLQHAITGDFGLSHKSGTPVAGQLLARIPASFQLMAYAMIIGLLIAFPVGVVCALWPHSRVTKVLNAYQSVTLAVPTFWVGILLVLIFSINLHVMPAVSDFVPFFSNPVGATRSTLLPALALAPFISSVIARFVTTSVTEVMGEDFIRTVRAKGVSEGRVIVKHGLRNALLPTITVVGLQVGHLLGGTMVVEAVFSYPGLGRMLFMTVLARDYTVVQATVLVIMLGFLVINLLVDILYSVVDPRVRLN